MSLDEKGREGFRAGLMLNEYIKMGRRLEIRVGWNIDFHK